MGPWDRTDNLPINKLAGGSHLQFGRQSNKASPELETNAAELQDVPQPL